MNKSLIPDDIYIQKTTKCDTRALDKNFTKADVKSDTKKHIRAVKDTAHALVNALETQVANHDFTKLDYLDEFTEALKSGLTDEEFYKLPWWKIHETEERHHLNQHCPEDVNLIDVLEMICDCVCAGKARTGKVYPIEINDKILQNAVKNTVDLLENKIKVTDED